MVEITERGRGEPKKKAARKISRVKRALTVFSLLFLSYALFANDAAVLGLTAPVDKLIATRPERIFRIGSIEYNVDDFVLSDFSGLLACDSRLSKYLSGEGDLYYEQLSEIIEQTILEKLNREFGASHAIVEASAENEIIVISIAIEYSRTALVPVYLETAERELTVSCAIPCLVEFSALLSIRVDSEIVLKEDAFKGCSVAVDHCSIKISSFDTYPQTVSAVYRDRVYAFSLVDFFLEAQCFWDVIDGTERECVDDSEEDAGGLWLTYGQIARNAYLWQSRSFGEIHLSLKQKLDDDGDSVDSGSDVDGVLEVNYTSDDLACDASEGTGPRVEIVDCGESFTLPLRVRRR